MSKFSVISRRGMAGYGNKNHKAPTLNDMPVPHGDFFELHAARQRKHRAVLIIGIGMLSSALFLVNITNFHSLSISKYSTFFVGKGNKIA